MNNLCQRVQAPTHLRRAIKKMHARQEDEEVQWPLGSAARVNLYWTPNLRISHWELINVPLHCSELRIPYVAKHFNTSDHILSNFRIFPNTPGIKIWNLGCKKKSFVDGPRKMFSCPWLQSIRQYRHLQLGLLESSLRSVGWRLHGRLPLSPSSPCASSSFKYHTLTEGETFFFPPNGKNSLKFCHLYRTRAWYFLIFVFYPD